MKFLLATLFVTCGLLALANDFSATNSTAAVFKTPSGSGSIASKAGE